MKILITGDRNWKDPGLIKEILELYKSESTIIALFANPIAPLVSSIAIPLGIPTEIVDSLEGIDYLLVFHKYIRGSVQCKVLIKEASNLGIPYQIVGSSF